MRAKLVVAIISLLVAAFGSDRAAQTGVATKAGMPAEVTGFEWKYQGYASAETVNDKLNSISVQSRRATVYVFKYTAKVSLRNLTAKTIKAVEWNYVFLDPESRKELKRYKIISKQQILPEAAQTLLKDIFIDVKENTRHFNTGKQQVLLARIEYTDGSVWRP